MSAPQIDHAVALLLRAIVGHARGDAATVVAARSELFVPACSTVGFEQKLVAATVDRMAHTCPHATRDELERAVVIYVRRRVVSSRRLAELKPWEHA